MRVRCRYSKTGKLRFVSAIDLGRVWERALRKAQLPIAYSEGFSPHPKVSFPDALPLGYASTGEYAELTFAGPIPLEPAMARLDAAFPDGIDVLGAIEVPEGAPRLSKWLLASLWRLDYGRAVDVAALAAAVTGVLAADRVVVERERKGESAPIDLRPAIARMAVEGQGVLALLHHQEPPVRPTEVHLALEAHLPSDALAALDEPVLVTRVAQGAPAEGGLVEALSGDIVPLRAHDRPTERTITP